MNQVVPEEFGFSSARLDRINTRMQWYVDEGLLAGMVTLVEPARAITIHDLLVHTAGFSYGGRGRQLAGYETDPI